MQAEAAASARESIRAHVEALIGSNAVLVLPSAPGPAIKLRTPAAQLDGFRTKLLCLTSPSGLSGLPQVCSSRALLNSAQKLLSRKTYMTGLADEMSHTAPVQSLSVIGMISQLLPICVMKYVWSLLSWQGIAFSCMYPSEADLAIWSGR